MKFSTVIGLTILVGLGACTAAPQTSATQMSPASAGSASASPQSPNGLPSGGVVNAPRTPTTGNVTTSVPTRGY